MGMRYVLGVVSVKRYYDVLLMILCVCFFFSCFSRLDRFVPGEKERKKIWQVNIFSISQIPTPRLQLRTKHALMLMSIECVFFFQTRVNIEIDLRMINGKRAISIDRLKIQTQFNLTNKSCCWPCLLCGLTDASINQLYFIVVLFPSRAHQFVTRISFNITKFALHI